MKCFIILDGVDGKFSKWMVDSIVLHLTDSLQPAILILNLHVVESSVNQVNADK